MSAHVKNIAASIRQRLKNKADALGVPFAQALQRYAIERFLYRLGKSNYRDAFVLKGAQMLVVWRGKRTRPTMDVDFLGFTANNPENLERIMKNICRVSTGEKDALQFDPESVKAVRIKEDAEYVGVRLTFKGNLGSAILSMQLDVGFNDAVIPGPLDICYPSLLDQPEPLLRGYSRESVVAEKFEAMVKLGIVNSRMKDFFDIWLLSQQFPFSGEMLSKAIRATFERRGTALNGLPVTLDPDFAGFEEKQIQWAAFLQNHKLAFAPSQFKEVAAMIAAFIKPVADGQGTVRNAAWPPCGPWKPS